MQAGATESLRLAAHALSAKRKSNGNGIDGWYPYYAGFSYDFAKAVLAGVAGGSRIVLDPWNGSGTTGAAAIRLGHTAIGYDLNPTTVVIARAKLATKSEVGHLRELATNCLANVRESRPKGASSDPLSRWLPPRAVAFARGTISALFAQDRVDNVANLSPSGCLLAICFLRALRDIAVDQSTSNATWIQPRLLEQEPFVRSIKTRMMDHVGRILQDIGACPTVRRKGCFADVGDARQMALPDASVDLVLSSPPYCTRIDYAKQTSLELAALLGFFDEDARPLREGLMGTTALRPARQTSHDRPAAIDQLLDTIARHPSHRSEAYYARNFAQYFDDAASAVQELRRVLKVGGAAILVLQNSFYKEIEIPLSSLFCELALANRMAASVVVQRPVSKTMNTLNTRARAYMDSRRYTEDVVLFENRG